MRTGNTNGDGKQEDASASNQNETNQLQRQQNGNRSATMMFASSVLLPPRGGEVRSVVQDNPAFLAVTHTREKEENPARPASTVSHS